MSLFGNSSNIYFNGSSATKVFLNGNVVWSLITETPTPTPTSSNNLILYFDPSDVTSYSGTGTTINDLSGNGLNGTMSNITFTSPYFTYNGSNSQVSIADNSLLEPGSGEFTMEVWFYKTSTSGSSVILGKFDDGGGSEDVSYSIRTNNTALFAQLGDGTGGVLNVDYVNSTSYTFSANTWYHVVYVWKPGVSLETFINGTSIGTISTTMSSILNSTNPLYLGRYNGGEFVQNFAGRIGIVRLHNTALTSTEVLNNYNNDVSKYISVTPTPTPTPTPTSTSNGEFVYVAQTGIPWNGYGANYLSFGRSQDGLNKTPLAGWYFKDSNNVVRQLLNTPLWFSGGNPSPYPNGIGWMAVANGSFYIAPTETTITFYETSPV